MLWHWPATQGAFCHSAHIAVATQKGRDPCELGSANYVEVVKCTKCQMYNMSYGELI